MNINIITSGLLDIYNNDDINIEKSVSIYNYKDTNTKRLIYNRSVLSLTFINQIVDNLYGLSLLSIDNNQILFNYCGKNIYMYCDSDCENIELTFTFTILYNNGRKRKYNI